MDSPEQWRWIWLAATAVFAIGEMATPGSFFLAPFAAGALVASLLAFAGVSVLVEWIAFIVVSVAMLALLRPLAKRLDRNALDHGVGSRRLIGRQATVLRAIPAGDEIGMVRVDREQWRAQSIDGTTIPEGIAVRIADVQGTRLIVASVDPTPPPPAPQPPDTATPVQPAPPTPPADPANPTGAAPPEATTDPAQPAGPPDTAPTPPAGSANAEPPAAPTDSTGGAPAAANTPAGPAAAAPLSPTASNPPASPAGGEPAGPGGADGRGGAGPANGSGEGEPVEPSAEPFEPPASGDGPSPS